MDRGRVGYAMIGNKEMREHLIKNGRKVHLERIRKIKMREPGSSSTLDNTEPHVIPALKKNPRKLGKMREANMMIERENKSLLKRISKILTAPPKINDDDYLKMKGLCQSMRGPKEIYEENLLKRHHKQLMKHLKQTGPFYSKKNWEESYRKQKIHQRFMREVTYKRLPGFIDPLEDKSKPVDPEKERRAIIERRNRAKEISGPPDMIAAKKLKLLKNSTMDTNSSINNSSNSYFERERMMSRAGSRGPNGMDSTYDSRGGGTGISDEEGWKGWSDMMGTSDNTSIDYSADGFDAEVSEVTGVDLCEIERMVKVEDDGNNDELNSQSYETLSIVKCSLVESESLIITAHSKQEPSLNSVAEIDLNQLADLKGFDEETKANLNTNVKLLGDLSEEVTNCVEFRLESGVPRLLLNLDSIFISSYL